MKTCCRCLQEKSVELFYRNVSSRDGRQAYCKECAKSHYKSWQNQSEERKNRHFTWKQARVAEHRAKLVKYLREHPCVDCQESDIRVLEFDHISDDKVLGVAALINRATAWDKIETEITKCEVRCCNCHRKVTSQRGNWWFSAL